jgi:hypothetical protein
MRKRTLFAILFLFLIIILIVIWFRTCESDKNKQATLSHEFDKETFSMVPSDATFIFSINTPTVLEKINFDSLRKTNDYLEKLKPYYPKNKPFAQVFANPIGCGVNVKENIIFYIDVGETVDEVYSATILKLNNDQLFSKMVVGEIESPPKEKRHHKELNIDSKSSVAWNSEFAIFITAEEGFNKSLQLKKTFDKKESKFFDTNPDFANWILKQNSDLYYWFDMGVYSKNQVFPIYQNRDLMDEKFLKEVVYKGNVNFDNGQITAQVVPKWNTYLEDLVTKILNNSPNTDLIFDIPNREITFCTGMSLNIEGLTQILLKDYKSKLLFRNKLRNYGLVISDFQKLLTGKLAFFSYPNSGTDKISTLLKFEINDIEKFDQILQLGFDLKYIFQESSNVYILPNPIIPFYPIFTDYEDNKSRLVLKGDYFIISADKSIIEYYSQLNTKNNQRYPKLINSIDTESQLWAWGTKNTPIISEQISSFNIKSYSLDYSKESGLKLDVILSEQNINSLHQILYTYK